MRVAASHLHMRRVLVEIALDTVQDLAKRIEEGRVSP